MVIVMPIGISGSGKSRLYNISYSDYEKVCPDDIRYELTGNISDQSCNGSVFKIAEARIDQCVILNKNVYYDATNLNKKLRKKFVEKYRGTEGVKIVYVVLLADIELSNERIRKDIDEHKNRSDVPYDVLERQMKMYEENIKQGFDDENVHEIIYLKKEDM